jgi:lambda family phage minor tail protein L
MADKIQGLSQKLELPEYVSLFRLDATGIGASVYHFTQSRYEETMIRWQGQDFVPIDVEAEGFEWTGTGPLPTPTLRVSNVNQVFKSLVINHRDGVGAVLTRWRTFRVYLDEEAEADPAEFHPPDVYEVQRKAVQTNRVIEWELSAALDQQAISLPARQVLRDACSHVYRRWDSTIGDFDYTNATCPYQDETRFYKPDNTATANPAEDYCAKIQTACKLHFGANALLPFRGFPGAARVRVR